MSLVKGNVASPSTFRRPTTSLMIRYCSSQALHDAKLTQRKQAAAENRGSIICALCGKIRVARLGTEVLGRECASCRQLPRRCACLPRPPIQALSRRQKEAPFRSPFVSTFRHLQYSQPRGVILFCYRTALSLLCFARCFIAYTPAVYTFASARLCCANAHKLSVPRKSRQINSKILRVLSYQYCTTVTQDYPQNGPFDSWRGRHGVAACWQCQRRIPDRHNR